MTLVCNNGNKYLSKIYSDYWAFEQGLQRALKGDLSDLIARRFDAGGTVMTEPDDTLLTAYNRMRAADVSQLPVLLNGYLVGIVDKATFSPLWKVPKFSAWPTSTNLSKQR